MLSLSLGATRRYLMVLLPLNGPGPPSYHKNSWSFCLTPWYMVLACRCLSCCCWWCCCGCWWNGHCYLGPGWCCVCGCFWFGVCLRTNWDTCTCVEYFWCASPLWEVVVCWHKSPALCVKMLKDTVFCREVVVAVPVKVLVCLGGWMPNSHGSMCHHSHIHYCHLW